MSDIEFEAEGELADDAVAIDAVAERIREYRLLCESLDKIRTKEIKSEGIEMLAKIRRSFKGYSEASVTSISGGKVLPLDRPL